MVELHLGYRILSLETVSNVSSSSMSLKKARMPTSRRGEVIRRVTCLSRPAAVFRSPFLAAASSSASGVLFHSR